MPTFVFQGPVEKLIFTVSSDVCFLFAGQWSLRLAIMLSLQFP